jgi:hypothetical protein
MFAKNFKADKVKSYISRVFTVSAVISIVFSFSIIVSSTIEGQQIALAYEKLSSSSSLSSTSSLPLLTHHKTGQPHNKISIEPLSSSSTSKLQSNTHSNTPPLTTHKSSSSNSINIPPTDLSTNPGIGATITTASTNKVAMLTFGDISDTQFTNAKPILDQYGFKGSFFVTCDWVGSKEGRMTWPQIVTLHNEGHDIESKAMTHKDLNYLSATSLDFEVGQSKQCLADHGINVTIFAPPHGDVWNNATVVNAISKYYNFADNGFSKLMFLHCNGDEGVDGSGQNVADLKPVYKTDCRTYLPDGTLTYSNKYSVKEWSHNSADVKLGHNDPQILQRFVEIIKSQNQFNRNGQIIAIPIIAYHSIDDSGGSSSTDVNEFAQEMKYLHDNGFRVVTMSSLAYDSNSNFMYLRDIPK